MESEYRIEFENQGVESGVVADDRNKPEVIRPVQTHSCNIAVILHSGPLPNLDKTDAIICFRREIPIGVRTADCVPLLIYAPDIQAIAAIHAGWRGSIGGIVTKTLNRLSELGADLHKAEAAFGPSICGKCYEVSPDMIQDFKNNGYEDCIFPERRLDLEMVNTKQLISSGISPQNIHHNKFCTLETPRLPSWREAPTQQRLLSWICMK